MKLTVHARSKRWKEKDLTGVGYYRLSKFVIDLKI